MSDLLEMYSIDDDDDNIKPLTTASKPIIKKNGNITSLIIENESIQIFDQNLVRKMLQEIRLLKEKLTIAETNIRTLQGAIRKKDQQISNIVRELDSKISYGN